MLEENNGRMFLCDLPMQPTKAVTAKSVGIHMFTADDATDEWLMLIVFNLV
jgi:hypothetical protein